MEVVGRAALSDILCIINSVGSVVQANLNFWNGFLKPCYLCGLGQITSPKSVSSAVKEVNGT